jgi:hypothetical protein
LAQADHDDKPLALARLPQILKHTLKAGTPCERLVIVDDLVLLARRSGTRGGDSLRLVLRVPDGCDPAVLRITTNT